MQKVPALPFRTSTRTETSELQLPVLPRAYSREGRFHDRVHVDMSVISYSAFGHIGCSCLRIYNQTHRVRKTTRSLRDFVSAR
jgi:hypothetical protein